MKLKAPLLIVRDIEKAKKFYHEVLGLHVIMDFGANVTLTGGISLQTEESWKEFIKQEITYGGNDTELYFEENNFDEFIQMLEKRKDISYIHTIMEHKWGQRVIRFYDLDQHIIEVGENIKSVCKHFIESGMTEEKVAERMDVPIKFVQACNK